MVSLLALFNRLIPFATPATPLAQDIVHLAILCALLYFAPQIQQRLQRLPHQDETSDGAGNLDQAYAPLDHRERIGTEENGPAVVAEPAAGDRERPRDVPREEQNPAAVRIGPDALDDGEPGPARLNPQANEEVARQRNVGAKKAKSLARKDQRRAYHEFMRAQGDSQRAQDAAGAEAREEALVAEKERRKKAELQLESRKAAERAAKRHREEATMEENARRIDLILQIVKDELEARRMCDLFQVARAVGDDVDEEWVEQVLRSSGIVGLKDDVMTMITDTGWATRVTMQDMLSVYRSAVLDGSGETEGRIAHESVAALLTASLRKQPDSRTT